MQTSESGERWKQELGLPRRRFTVLDDTIHELDVDAGIELESGAFDIGYRSESGGPSENIGARRDAFESLAQTEIVIVDFGN